MANAANDYEKEESCSLDTGGTDVGSPWTVAALYVERDGVYWNLPGVDPWDEARDARAYAGPYPVVAHPPCARWGQLADLLLELARSVYSERTVVA